MKLITRSAWGARHGRGPTNITPSKGGVAVHYVGGGKLTDVPHTKCAARVRSIESQHVNGNGWAAIAYSYLSCEHGFVFEGRGLGHRTAAQGTNSGNQNHYAVCALIGDKDTPNDALKAATRDAIDYCRKNGAGSSIKGHFAFHPTSCPGSHLKAWVAAGAPRPGGTVPPAPPAGGTPWPGRLLRLSNPYLRGEDVRWIQQRLNAKGASPKLTVDGVFGPNTAREVTDYQRGHGLDPDSIVGRLTWNSLAAP